MQNIAATQNNSIWKNHVFLVLISTSVLVGFGQKIYAIAIPLIVYEFTQSSEWMGLMRSVEFLPNLLLALFVGVWVDRSNKKVWAMTMLITQSLLMVATFLIVYSGKQLFWLLFPLTFLINACSYGYYNSKMVILKQGIDKEHLNLATARLSGVTNFFDTLGPAISGLILFVAALYWPLLWVGISFGISAIIISKLQWNGESIRKSGPIFKSISEGWGVLKSHQALFALTWLIMVINTTGGMFEIQMIFAAKDLFDFSNAQIGFLVSAAGTGAFIGALYAPAIRKRFGLGRTMLISAGIEALCFLLPVLFQAAWAVYLTMFMSVGFGIITSICIWSYRSEVVESEYFGRVAGLTGSIFKIGLPIGLAASGFIVSNFSVFTLFSICAVVQLTGVLIFNRKQIREII